MGVDRRPRDGLQPLELSRRGHVHVLEEDEDDPDGHDDHRENGQDDDDEDDRTEQVEELGQPVLDVHGKGIVANIHVLGKALRIVRDGFFLSQGRRGHLHTQSH